MKFEYEVCLSFSGQEPEFIKKQLNSKGCDEWELVGVSGMAVYFKRGVAENQKTQNYKNPKSDK